MILEKSTKRTCSQTVSFPYSLLPNVYKLPRERQRLERENVSFQAMNSKSNPRMVKNPILIKYVYHSSRNSISVKFEFILKRKSQKSSFPIWEFEFITLPHSVWGFEFVTPPHCPYLFNFQQIFQGNIAIRWCRSLFWHCERTGPSS